METFFAVVLGAFVLLSVIIGSTVLASHAWKAAIWLARWTAKVWRAAQARQERIDVLEEVCAEAYKVLGALNGPARMLDNLSAASQGKAPPHVTCLPFVPARKSRRKQ